MRLAMASDLFHSVQDVLNGRRLSVAPKRKHNPNFPLKCFVRCESCGTPLTGGLVTGKNKAHKFGYYWCRNPHCRAVMVRREKLEDLFVDYLRGLKPDNQAVVALPEIAEQVWTQRQGDAEASARKLRARLDEQKRLKSELLRAKLRGEVAQADYAAANAEFDAEIAMLNEQFRATQLDRASFEEFLRFANAALVDIASAWECAESEERLGVQTLLFQNALRYSQERGNFEHLNPCLYSRIAEIQDKNWWLASPTGFEPVLPP
jgi:site-specific DNA recombinase